MTTLEERVSHLEGAYEHLATKADVAEAKAELKADISEVKAALYQMESRLIRWMVGMLLGSVVGASSIAILVQRLIG